VYSVDAPLTDKSLRLGARESQRIAIPHNTYLENNAIDGFAERMEGGLGGVLCNPNCAPNFGKLNVAIVPLHPRVALLATSKSGTLS